MNSHGHVNPNPDGSKARCGGPVICSACALELAGELAKITTKIEHPENDWHQKSVALLGKRVRIKLDDSVITQGKFLGFSDGGECEVLEDDGFVHHCWPMLSVEEVEDEG